MTEQATLFEVEPSLPKLRDRQQYALDEISAAGAEGIHTDELGALLCQRNGRHPAGDRCTWCSKNGLDVLNRLRELGLVRYQAKLKAWTATGIPDLSSETRTAKPGTVPYNQFPEGF